MTKTGTPTMGGIMIILSVILSSVIWADLSNKYIIFGILIMLSFGALGFFDDYTKLKKNSKGIKAKTKFLNKIFTVQNFSVRKSHSIINPHYAQKFYFFSFSFI